MLSQLQQGLKSFFEREDGAYEKAISWTCQEKFRPGKNDLVLVFPRQRNKVFLANYVKAIVALVSGWIGLRAEECSVSGSSGHITLSGNKEKVLAIVNCTDGPNKSMLLLRLFGQAR